MNKKQIETFNDNNEEIIFHDDTPINNDNFIDKKWNEFAIIAFCLLLIRLLLFILDFAVGVMLIPNIIKTVMTVSTIFCSIVALVQSKKKKQKGKSLALISLFGLLLIPLSVIILIMVSLSNGGAEEWGQFINTVRCSDATQCIKNGETSVCLYEDEEITCETDQLNENQFKE